MDLLCLGEAMVEFNQASTGEAYRQGFGGDTSNAAIAAARSGARTGYVSATGEDAFGDMLHALWRAEGVSDAGVRRMPGAETGIYFVTHGAEGHAFSYRRTGSAAARMAPEDLDPALLRQTRALHVSAISQAISASACDTVFAAIEVVREAGGLISYDTNLRLSLWPLARARAIITATVPLCDILLPGLDDARQITGLEAPAEIANWFRARGAGIVALTLGGDGVLVADASGSELIAPHKVAAVDATGAGDAFDGAFLARYLETGDAREAARYGNAAAALAVGGYGAVAPLPHRAKVEALLARREGGGPGV